MTQPGVGDPLGDPRWRFAVLWAGLGVALAG